MKTKTLSSLPGYSQTSCKGFGEVAAACNYAKDITNNKRDLRWIIQTGDVFFVSDTGDVQRYEKLLFVYQNGVQIDKDPRKPVSAGHIGAPAYVNKYKVAD